MRCGRGSPFGQDGPGLFHVDGQIALDNSWADTYHTRACLKGLPSTARNMYAGNRVNRGADFYDE